MDPKVEKIISTIEKKMLKGCWCIEAERKKLEIYVDKDFWRVKPKGILQFYEDLDLKHFCDLVLNCKCFDKNVDANYINPTTLINIL